MSRLRFLQAAVATAVVSLAASAMPSGAHAVPINGTATLNDLGITLNNGTDLSNTSSIGVATFTVVAETGNITVGLGTTEPGTTFDLTSLSTLVFSGPIDFKATSGSIANQSPTFLNIIYTGTASAAGLDDTAGTLTVTFTDNSGTLGGSNVVAAFHSAVPEPVSISLLGAGLVGLAVARRRRIL